MKIKEERKNEILELVKQGITYEEICKRTKCAIGTITKYCKENNIKSKYHFSGATEEQILNMQKLYNEHKSALKVAKILEISKSTVLKYVTTIKRIKTKESRKKDVVKAVLNWRIKVKAKLVDYKGSKCEKCGYNKCISALEFHHLNPNEKDISIGGSTKSFEVLKKEVDKCIMVCANCHREIHEEIRNNKKSQICET